MKNCANFSTWSAFMVTFLLNLNISLGSSSFIGYWLKFDFTDNYKIRKKFTKIA